MPKKITTEDLEETEATRNPGYALVEVLEAILTGIAFEPSERARIDGLIDELRPPPEYVAEEVEAET